jgi:hypothetical protein
VLLAITPAKLQKINIEDDSVSEDVQLLQGDVLIYEPNELQMSFFGRARIIELVVMPRFAGQKLLIASAGISDWLADHFTTRLMGSLFIQNSASRVFRRHPSSMRRVLVVKQLLISAESRALLNL